VVADPPAAQAFSLAFRILTYKKLNDYDSIQKNFLNLYLNTTDDNLLLNLCNNIYDCSLVSQLALAIAADKQCMRVSIFRSDIGFFLVFFKVSDQIKENITIQAF